MRSTMPLYSGSRGGASLIWVASVPANATAGVVNRPVPPMAASRSHTRVVGTRPIWLINSHIPDRMSPAWRDGIIVALANRENASVITSTGNTRCWPAPTGIFTAGNHKSHWAICPGS